MGFFTDTTVCIGCKACEVACKQWNDLPADGVGFRRGTSYDHTGELAADDLAPRALRRGPRPDPRRRGARAVAAGGGQARRRPGRGPARHPGRRRRRRGAGCGGDALDAGPGDLDLVGVGRRRPRAGPLGLHVGRLQALHERRLPGRLPDGRAHPHGVRDRGAPARRLQRLRLLRPGLPVRRRGPRPRRRPRREVHPLLRPPPGRPRAGVREGLPDRLDPVRPLRRARRRRAAARRATARATASTAAYLYGAGDPPGAQLAGGLGAFFLLTEPPERFGLPAQAESPIQENVVPATAAAVGAGLLAAAGVAAAFVLGRADARGARRGGRAARDADRGAAGERAGARPAPAGPRARATALGRATPAAGARRDARGGHARRARRRGSAPSRGRRWRSPEPGWRTRAGPTSTRRTPPTRCATARSTATPSPRGPGRARGGDPPGAGAGPDPQAARVDVGGAAVLLVRRDRLRLGLRRARLRPLGRPPQRGLGPPRGARRARALPVAARPRPRAPRALPPHAADGQAALARCTWAPGR